MIGEGETAESTEGTRTEREGSKAEGTQKVWKKGAHTRVRIFSLYSPWLNCVLQVQQDILQKRREEKKNAMKMFKKGKINEEF